VADTYNHRIRRVTPDGVVSTIAGAKSDGSLNGPVAKAMFYRPRSVVLDSGGTIYVSDRYNHRIRKIADGMVTTLQGWAAGFADGDNDMARFYYPCQLAVDAAGTLALADGHNHRVRKIRPSTGSCSVAGSCYADGVRKPGAPCQGCVSSQSVKAWTALADKAWCSDGTACTGLDLCAKGSCQGKAKACDDANKCTTDSCDKVTGACGHGAIVGCKP
jgi:hypothetical protein